MSTRVDPGRIRALNNATVRAGDYVLYWMQASHRTENNPALVYAIERADAAGLPLVVFFCLDESFPEANLRHFTFLLEGLAEVSRSLESLGILFVMRLGDPVVEVALLAKDAALVVIDRGYLRQQVAWYREAAGTCRCPVVQVESNVVVPVETASEKEEYSAATLRPKIERLLDRFLYPLPLVPPVHPAHSLEIDGMAAEPASRLLSAIEIDRSVSPSRLFSGGRENAMIRFSRFLDRHLDGFARNRNDPGGDGCSGMSPYLHFGQVSPVTLALQARDHGGDGVPAFLEELIVRRELAVNFVRYNPAYDSFASLPAWAKTTLLVHERDPREYIYTRDELERAATHDPYWNAAQREMTVTGKMQGYMRMYWGKKILEWSARPEEAYATALYLNNRYEIDGRDPNGYAGIAWCFGKHDRPWKERGIFGTVRYMNARGLERKFAMDRYLGNALQIPGPA